VSGFAAHARPVRYDRDSGSYRRIEMSTSRTPAGVATN
jgi:hypothetical protein